MIETLLLYFFGGAALLGGVLMLVLRHPMRVALALVGVMLSLAGVYALLGVHVVAVFQVLIYVGAVMVFMVYTIMLLDSRDPTLLQRWTRLKFPGLLAVLLFLAGVGYGLWHAPPAATPPDASFGIKEFSFRFLNEYWLHFELISVLLLAVIVGALAVLRGTRPHHG